MSRFRSKSPRSTLSLERLNVIVDGSVSLQTFPFFDFSDAYKFFFENERSDSNMTFNERLQKVFSRNGNE